MLSDVLILVAWQSSVHKFLQEVVKDAFNWEKTLSFLILSTQNVSQWFWTWSWQSLESSIIAHFELCTVIYCRTVLKNYVTRMGLILENTKAFNKLDLKRSSRVSQRKNFSDNFMKTARIQSEYRKIRTRKNSAFGYFSRGGIFRGSLCQKSKKLMEMEKVKRIRKDSEFKRFNFVCLGIK